MSVQFCKSGNVNAGSIVESDGMMVNTTTKIGYTPVANNLNSCINYSIVGFEVGKEYYVEMFVSWNGFNENVADNFNMRAQGAVYDGSAWTWSVTNHLTKNIGSFTSLVLSADKGQKQYRYKFTAAYTGYQLGCRTDYSNGTGTITYSNIKIVPADSYVQSSVTSGHILKGSIAMDNFIEN